MLKGKKTKTIEVSVIVPVYNEEKSVAQTLERLQRTMRTADFSYEIIAVDDGSKDTSPQILENWKGIKVVHHPVNKGYSSSLKAGIKLARGSLIAITDADGTYPVEELPQLLQWMKEYDMVVGARTGKYVAIPLLRRPAKWLLGAVANYIAERKIPDINSGLRVFKKELALEFWKLFPERFSFTITITLASITNGYNVKFVPINYYPRKGKSTIHPFNDFISFNKILVKLMLFFRPLKIFVPLGLGTMMLAIILFLVGLFLFNHFLDATLVLLVIAGIQFLVLGLIAELIVRKL